MRRTIFFLLFFAMPLATVNAQDVAVFGNWSVQAGLTNVMTSAVKSAGKGGGQPSASDKGLGYVPDPEVSRKAEMAVIALTQKSNPSAVEKLKQTLRANDIVSMFDQDMAPFDLSSNDLPDVFTAFIVANWMIANKAEIPAVSAVSAVRNNIANGMGNAISRLDDEQRQMIAEVLVYQTMFSIGARTAAMNNPEKMDRLSDQAHNILTGMGVDARAYALGDSGLVPR